MSAELVIRGGTVGTGGAPELQRSGGIKHPPLRYRLA